MGKFSQAESKKSKTLPVRMSEGFYERLESHSIATSLTKAEIIRRAVADYINRWHDTQQKMREANKQQY